MVKQGGVRIDGEKIKDRNLQLDIGFEGVLQVGKRKFCKAYVK
jgi:tyrosyl-tRNA synthetase